jgi:hypothetical protein
MSAKGLAHMALNAKKPGPIRPRLFQFVNTSVAHGARNYDNYFCAGSYVFCAG